MTRRCAAIFAALFLWSSAPAVLAQDVTLTSRDGDVEISGDLLGFDGEFYRVDTIYGELTVDGSGVQCEGPGCPNLDQYVARITFAGEPTIGRVLMPGLLEAFAIKSGYLLDRSALQGRDFAYRITDKASGQQLGEFTFRMTSSDEGFADLLADQADIVMTLREVREAEIVLGRDAGLGDLSSKGRNRVVALDALVPVVSPTNPVQDVTVPELADIFAGNITNWAVLGGADAPIAVHMLDARTGLGQATEDQVLTPAAAIAAGSIIRHPTNEALLEAVMRDPFAIAVTSQSDIGNTWPLALKGKCGFAMRATRRAVKTEDYPLTTPLFLYMPARRFPKLVREFLNYLRDPSAQLVIRRAGFVDQTPEEIAIDAQGDRFANAIMRAGDEISLRELQAMVRTLEPLKRLTTTFRFEAGSARLDAQSRSNVLQLARAMELGHYDARRLVFVGFSDGQGPAEKNLEIARERAEAVSTAVKKAAETANLARIGIEALAFGEAMPMACDNSEWGRRVNRRVEVWVR